MCRRASNKATFLWNFVPNSKLCWLLCIFTVAQRPSQVLSILSDVLWPLLTRELGRGLSVGAATCLCVLMLWSWCVHVCLWRVCVFWRCGHGVCTCVCDVCSVHKACHSSSVVPQRRLQKVWETDGHNGPGWRYHTSQQQGLYQRYLYCGRHLSVCLSVCLSVSVCLLLYLPVCLSACLSVCLFVCLPACLSMTVV